MNSINISRLAIFAAITLCAAGRALAEDAIYSCLNADGSTELVGAPNGGQCEKLVSAPDPAPVAAAASASTQTAQGDAAAPAQSTLAPAQPPNLVKAALIPPPDVAQKPRNAVESRLSDYRSAMIDQASQMNADTQQASGPTSSSSRRYLMVNRETYRQSLGISAR
jgi:hypothetical protein